MFSETRTRSQCLGVRRPIDGLIKEYDYTSIQNLMKMQCSSKHVLIVLQEHRFRDEAAMQDKFEAAKKKLQIGYQQAEKGPYTFHFFFF